MEWKGNQKEELRNYNNTGGHRLMGQKGDQKWEFNKTLVRITEFCLTRVV